MKKNVILLVIDSVYDKSTYSQSYKNGPMPFLTELRKKAFMLLKYILKHLLQKLQLCHF